MHEPCKGSRPHSGMRVHIKFAVSTPLLKNNFQYKRTCNSCIEQERSVQVASPWKRRGPYMMAAKLGRIFFSLSSYFPLVSDLSWFAWRKYLGHYHPPGLCLRPSMDMDGKGEIQFEIGVPVRRTDAERNNPADRYPSLCFSWKAEGRSDTRISSSGSRRRRAKRPSRFVLSCWIPIVRNIGKISEDHYLIMREIKTVAVACVSLCCPLAMQRLCSHGTGTKVTCEYIPTCIHFFV